ncbi:MAG: hypothetical protein DRO92_04155 [Candidatus Altiarchaeales archaeon]|nr:MAG: hypothetical protein DRO92_04155 [Candidatus Altiarchaeales archaeon]
MKLYPECAPCMLQRALMFCENEGGEKKYEVIRAVSKFFAENFTENLTTTKLAYERNKIIESITHNKDPMKDIKDKSFSAALKLYPTLKDHIDKIDNDKERFITALRIALAGNTLEFGARDHKPDLSKLEDEIFDVINGSLSIDDSDKIYDIVKNSKRILYVTDNAAEVIMDKILIEDISRYATVYISPLSRPVQDDACIDDIKKAGLDNNYNIIPRGDSIGVWFEKTTKEFQRIYDNVDFVIAKGMGCYETLIDYPERTRGRVGLLMKVKCLPVSLNINAPIGSNVIKIL